MASASLLNRQDGRRSFEGVLCGSPTPQTCWLFEQASLALPREVATLRPLVGQVMELVAFEK